MTVHRTTASALRAFGHIRPKALFGLALLATAAIVGLVGLLGGGLVNELLLYLPGIDKVLHFTGFFVFFVALSTLMKTLLPDLRGGVPLLVSTLVLLAAGDEIAQAVRPNRTLELADFVVGLCGVAMGLCWRASSRRPRAAAAGALLSLVIAGYITFESFSQQRHINAAIRLARTGDFIGARLEYRAALDAGVRTASLYNELSWVEIESGIGDARAAVQYSRLALEMKPDDVDIFDTHGWALHHAGQSAAALPYLERAYAEKPGMYCIHYHLGMVYLALGQFEKATAHLRLQMERRNTREAAFAELALARLSPHP